MAYLDLVDLQVGYEKNVSILDGFNLTVAEGELVSLLGPSGCGKTTTFRTVAGFIEPTAGRVIIAGEDNTRLVPNKRDIGLVFQSYALFPHLTVDQNVAFGLRMRRVRGQEAMRRVAAALALVGLTGFGERRPSQLSGGQRQRVAVARAIVIEPKLLLMDEPLSNLDAKLRVGMRTELRRLQQRLGITMLYVTHDQTEALTLSDRIVVMNHGRIEQIGTPEEIFYHPATPFAADFMGFDNRCTGRIATVHDRSVTVDAAGHTIAVQLRMHDERLNPGTPVHLYFRPEAASLAATAQPNSLPGTVSLRTFRGSSVEYLVTTPAGEFAVHVDDEEPRGQGDNVHVVLDARRLVVMPQEDRP